MFKSYKWTSGRAGDGYLWTHLFQDPLMIKTGVRDMCQRLESEVSQNHSWAEFGASRRPIRLVLLLSLFFW